MGDAVPACFRVPFGPYLVPALSLLSCLFIMKDLPGPTFRVFTIWMTVAILVYFVYGVRNSSLNAGPRAGAME